MVPLQSLAEPDVQHAFRDDRVEGGSLGPGSNRADGAAAELDRRGEPDVDQVARRQSAGRGVAVHAGSRRATSAAGSTERMSPGADSTR